MFPIKNSTNKQSSKSVIIKSVLFCTTKKKHFEM